MCTCIHIALGVLVGTATHPPDGLISYSRALTLSYSQALGVLVAKATFGFGGVLALGSVVLRRIFSLVASSHPLPPFRPNPTQPDLTETETETETEAEP